MYVSKLMCNVFTFYFAECAHYNVFVVLCTATPVVEGFRRQDSAHLAGLTMKLILASLQWCTGRLDISKSHTTQVLCFGGTTHPP